MCKNLAMFTIYTFDHSLIDTTEEVLVMPIFLKSGNFKQLILYLTVYKCLFKVARILLLQKKKGI